MKDQLESLVAQMYSSGILYSEGIREFKKRFIMNVLRAEYFPTPKKTPTTATTMGLN